MPAARQCWSDRVDRVDGGFDLSDLNDLSDLIDRQRNGMPSDAFMSGFDAGMRDAGSVLGEEWWLLSGVKDEAGTGYPAISMDGLEAGAKVVVGGKLVEVTVSILISEKVAADSGVTHKSVVRVSGEVLRVMTILNERDGTVSLRCGPAGVTMK